MLITNNQRYIKKHIVGGSGIFDTVLNFFLKAAGSAAAQKLAANISTAARTEIGKKALGAVKEVGLKAIDVGKDVAIAKANSYINRAVPAVLTPANQEALKKLTGLTPNPPVVTQKSKDILASLINVGASEATTNINKLIAGSGVNKAISIQDLVKKLNGSGLKLA